MANEGGREDEQRDEHEDDHRDEQQSEDQCEENYREGPIEGDDLMQSLDDLAVNKKMCKTKDSKALSLISIVKMSIPILIHHSSQPLIHITIQNGMDIR